MVQGTGYSFWFVKIAPESTQDIHIYERTKSFGDLSDVGTPGNIPNPVVKHVSADGTRRVTSRESRSLPKDFFFLTR